MLYWPRVHRSVPRVKRSLQGFERGPAADVWRHTLSQIPYVLGRMAYLASLRNPNTGRYEHHGLAQIYGADKAHRTLLASHEAAFSDWLNYDLAQQESDLRLYLLEVGSEPHQVLDAWNHLGTHRTLIPMTASDAQRDLFLMDIEALLLALRNAAASGRSVASPLP